MPISAVSPLMRIHSWSFVYLRSAGYAIVTPGGRERPPLPFPFVERQRHYPSLARLAAHVDLDLRSGGRVFGRHVRHADRLFQVRRLRPAGDDAGTLAGGDHGITMPRDAAIDHFEPDQLACHAGRLLSG